MKRRLGAIFLLFVFLQGSLGFSLTRHYCTHTGKELYALGNSLTHLCSEATDETSCCEKVNKPMAASCCDVQKLADNYCSSKNAEMLKDNCCTDQESFYQIRDSWIKNVADWQINVPVHNILFVSFLHTVASELKGCKATSFALLQIPPLLASEKLSILCVFQI
jgi:hypothetical protein